MLNHNFLRKLSSILIILLAGTVYINSSEKKKVITLEDIKLWRTHKTTLADNGNWYTVIYSLKEKPEKDSSENKTDKKTGSEKKEDKSKKATPSLYGKDAETDVLYIRHVNSEKEYKIEKGAKPCFSPSSEWIAYTIKPEDEKEGKKSVELKNLKSGKTWKWESDASYFFTERSNYFISSDKKGILLFNLATHKEFFIGSTGEHLTDKRSDLLIYTIKSEDKRGNGIYSYNLKTRITKALDTGNFNYTYLSWNRDAVAAYKFSSDKDKKIEDVRLVTIKNINSSNPSVREYKHDKVKGLPEKMVLAVEKSDKSRPILWSNDNSRLFISIKEDQKDGDKDKAGEKKSKEKPTVNVWHWKDKKLVSQQMFEADKKNRTYRALFILSENRLVQLTSISLQKLHRSKGTDNWAVGTDNREWISDWNVSHRDLYRINLRNGRKDLIIKGSYSSIDISPDGENLLLWDKNNYWCYNFRTGKKTDITGAMKTSFIDKEDDHAAPAFPYGLSCWVKDRKSVVLRHKLDLWQIPLDGKSSPRNLTKSVTSKHQIKFRIQDRSFRYKEEISERYLNLKNPVILTAFNIKTKEAGYYNLKGRSLKKLIFGKSSYSASRRNPFDLKKAKNGTTVIYRKGSYIDYPESWIGNLNFTGSRRISSTNPQQKNYKWGSRILISYKNDDGVQLQGILSIPEDYKKGEKRPMIVYSYEKLSDGLFRYASPGISGAVVSEMQYVSEGYLFLQPDIHFNVGTPHSDMLECIDAAIEKTMGFGYVDPEDIGYQGFSYGGHAGMYMSTQKNHFAAIAAGAGVSNLTQGFNVDIVWDGSNEQDYYMVSQGRLGVNPTANPEMYIRESAVYSADKMETPLLLFHGTADKVVQWEHSFGFYSILRFLKKPVILLSYRGEGHGMRKKANRFDVQTKLKQFFDHHLKGVKAPEWIKNGLPYKPEKKNDKNKKEKDKTRTVPQWM